MSHSEAWERAWLNNKPMPPRTFPDGLLQPMLDLGDHWLISDNGPRTQLEEFVSRVESYDVMDGLLYSGFCRDRSRPQRVRPVPVVIQLLYRIPAPADRDALVATMSEVFGRVVSEWCREYMGGRGPLYTAP